MKSVLDNFVKEMSQVMNCTMFVIKCYIIITDPVLLLRFNFGAVKPFPVVVSDSNGETKQITHTHNTLSSKTTPEGVT